MTGPDPLEGADPLRARTEAGEVAPDPVASDLIRFILPLALRRGSAIRRLRGDVDGRERPVVDDGLDRGLWQSQFGLDGLQFMDELDH